MHLEKAAKMEPLPGARSARVALRDLGDPVRSFMEAFEEIIANLLYERDQPNTPPQRQAQIAERLALVKNVVGEADFALIAGKFRPGAIT
jgi:hypothetical protein